MTRLQMQDFHRIQVAQSLMPVASVRRSTVRILTNGYACVMLTSLGTRQSHSRTRVDHAFAYHICGMHIANA
jgi:hypothetical protein